MGRAIGIDLGTTFCVAAVMVGGVPKIVPTAEGGNLVPSVVAVDAMGKILVGEPAKRQAILNPENTIFGIKRLIGRRFEDPSVQSDMKRLPYKITRAPNGDCRVGMASRQYSPEEVSAMLLQKLKADAERYLGGKVTEAVVTVPAYFSDAQRKATKDAATIAGLNVLRTINESTAAALAYGLNRREGGTVAIYDLGGGTFDVSILSIGEGTFQVKSTNGDTHLGGDDFDHCITDWVCDEFKKRQDRDLKNDRIALQRIKEAAERAKIELSTVQQAEVNLPFITADASGPRHLSLTLTRAKLEQLCAGLVDRSIEPCRRAVSDACLRTSQINDVILVGYQTRMPLVQEKVRQFFGKASRKGINIDEAVASGAAIQAGILTGELGEVLLLDVTPLTLGVETVGGVATPLISRNTTIPTSRSQVFSTASDNQPSVEIHVVQGEHAMVADNLTLARFILDGILPAPRGIPQVEVTFDIDGSGILSVSARDKGTRREQKVTITASGGLSRSQVEIARQEAADRVASLLGEAS
jgi:molecular chaperone DnaK